MSFSPFLSLLPHAFFFYHYYFLLILFLFSISSSSFPRSLFSTLLLPFSPSRSFTLYPPSFSLSSHPSVLPFLIPSYYLPLFVFLFLFLLFIFLTFYSFLFLLFRHLPPIILYLLPKNYFNAFFSFYMSSIQPRLYQNSFPSSFWFLIFPSFRFFLHMPVPLLHLFNDTLVSLKVSFFLCHS